MAIKNELSAQRIDRIKVDVLSQVAREEWLGISGKMEPMREGHSGSITYQYQLPKEMSVDDRQLALDHWDVEPVQVAPGRYFARFSWTDMTPRSHQDSIPSEILTLLGGHIGHLTERIRLDKIKTCPNVFFGGTGNARCTVNGTLTTGLLEKIKRLLVGNHAKEFNQIISPSHIYGTNPVEDGYIAFCHTDIEHDAREIKHFQAEANYGSRKKIHAREFGSVGRIRFVSSPDLQPYRGAGASGVGGLLTTPEDGTGRVDVYPVVILGMNAWADLALRGRNSIQIHGELPGKATQFNPTGQRGWLSAEFWLAPFILNPAWIVIAEVGASKITH